MRRGFIWSSTSFQLVAQYSIEDPAAWFLNTSCGSVPLPSEFPDRNGVTVVCEPSGSNRSSSCALYTLEGLFYRPFRGVIISQTDGAVALLTSQGDIWFGEHRVSSVLPVTVIRNTLQLGNHTPVVLSLYTRAHPKIFLSQPARMVCGFSSVIKMVSQYLLTYRQLAGILPYEYKS